MKRRIRKKKHVGEFLEMGFSAKCKVHPEAGDPEFNRFWDEFIGEIERLELCFGGGVGEICDGYVASYQPQKRGRRTGSVTETQRLALQQWLQNHPRVYEVTLGALSDAWNGPFDDDKAACGEL